MSKTTTTPVRRRKRKRNAKVLPPTTTKLCWYSRQTESQKSAHHLLLNFIIWIASLFFAIYLFYNATTKKKYWILWMKEAYAKQQTNKHCSLFFVYFLSLSRSFSRSLFVDWVLSKKCVLECNKKKKLPNESNRHHQQTKNIIIIKSKSSKTQDFVLEFKIFFPFFCFFGRKKNLNSKQKNLLISFSGIFSFLVWITTISSNQFVIWDNHCFVVVVFLWLSFSDLTL